MVLSPYSECLGSFFGHFNSEILSKQWTRKVIDWVLPCFWSVPIARNLFSHMIYPSKTVWAVALLVFVHVDTLILKFVVLISNVWPFISVFLDVYARPKPALIRKPCHVFAMAFTQLRFVKKVWQPFHLVLFALLMFGPLCFFLNLRWRNERRTSLGEYRVNLLPNTTCIHWFCCCFSRRS